MRKLTLILLVSILVHPAIAQNNDEEKIENVFKGTRFVNSHSANVAERGKLLLLIQHRFGSIDGGLYELFGLDQATMRIGFEYGLGENFTVGFGRSSYLKTYDLFGKLLVMKQSATFPLTAAVTAGGSIPTLRDYYPDDNDNFSDKLSGNIQIHIARTFNNFGLLISPGYLTTGYLPTENESLSLFITSFGASFKFSKNVTANIEYLAHFHSDFDAEQPLSLGVDYETGGHLFQLIVSNSQQMFTKGLHTATFGDWTDGSVYFGFNLIREFRIKYY